MFSALYKLGAYLGNPIKYNSVFKLTETLIDLSEQSSNKVISLSIKGIIGCDQSLNSNL